MSPSEASATVASPADDLGQVRDLLLGVLGEGRTDEAVALVMELLAAMRDKNTELALRLQRELSHRYGRRCEGVTSEQLSLFLGRLPEVTEAQDGDDQDDPDEPVPAPRKPTKRTGRRPLPADLPRDERVVALDEAQVTCDGCGDELGVVEGHDALLARQVRRIRPVIPGWAPQADRGTLPPLGGAWCCRRVSRVWFGLPPAILTGVVATRRSFWPQWRTVGCQWRPSRAISV